MVKIQTPVAVAKAPRWFVMNLRSQLDKEEVKNITQRILRAFNTGYSFTSKDLNDLARTVDTRKYISDLRNKKSLNIQDQWVEVDGKRLKEYRLEK
jgi:hypothetical protein